MVPRSLKSISPDFVSQLCWWALGALPALAADGESSVSKHAALLLIFLQSCETKSGMESLGLRLQFPGSHVGVNSFVPALSCMRKFEKRVWYSEQLFLSHGRDWELISEWIITMYLWMTWAIVFWTTGILLITLSRYFRNFTTFSSFCEPYLTSNVRRNYSFFMQ